MSKSVIVETHEEYYSREIDAALRPGCNMTTATDVKQETAPVTEHRWKKAQTRYFNELQADIQQAKADLEKAERAAQRYVGALSEEYELDPDKPWLIGPHGFVLQPEQPKSPNGDGNGEQGQQNGAAPGAEEGQTTPPTPQE